MDEFNIEQDLLSSCEELNEEELETFAELFKDGIKDEEVKLYIYSCLRIHQKWHKEAFLERAVQRVESWIAMATGSHRDYRQRYGILNVVRAESCRHDLTPETVEAIQLRGVEAVSEQDIHMQTHAFEVEAVGLAQNFQQTGCLSDLNKAIRILEYAMAKADNGLMPHMFDLLGAMFAMRFDQKRSMSDLDRAISVATIATNLTPHGDPQRPQHLLHLGYSLNRRYKQTESISDLDHAISIATAAVKALPDDDDQERAGYLSNLGGLLRRRYEMTQSVDDLSQAASVMTIAADATPQNHPDRADRLDILAGVLARQFERTRSTDDIERSLSIARAVVSATPHHHPRRSERLSNIGVWLIRQFEQTGTMDHLDEAINMATAAADAAPHDHPHYPDCHRNLGILLQRRYEEKGSIDDLNQAIRVMTVAADIMASDHPNRAEVLVGLRNQLSMRFQQLGSGDDLKKILGMATPVVEEATPQRQPNRASDFKNFLAMWLGRRFEQMGSMDDLHKAIRLAAAAVDNTPRDDPSRAIFLNTLGMWLGRRYESTGSIDDLDRAVSVVTAAMNTIHQSHPERAAPLINLGFVLIRRYEQTGSIDNLDQAISITTAAIDATLPHQPLHAISLSNLGFCLFKRFERKGLMKDLDQAISAASTVLDVTSLNHLNRAGFLNNLGSWLGARFQQTGSTDDLDQAVSVTTAAIDAAPNDHPNYPCFLGSLGTWLSCRFERTGSMGDLNQAVEVTAMSADTISHDHPDYIGSLNNLGNRLFSRFKLTESMDDLNKAIQMVTTALDATPPDHAERTSYLSNLGTLLGERFQRTGSIDDLDQAVSATTAAVDGTPQDHLGRAGFLFNLGTKLGLRFKQTGSPDDQQAQLRSFLQGWDCTMANPSVRIQSAQFAANILLSQHEWEKASQLLQDAILLLPRISPRSLSRTDSHTQLARFFGLASTAAAAALQAGKSPEDALRLLELGRGVVAGILMDMRGDITDLRLKHPALADQFNALRDELDSSIGSLEPRSNSDTMSSRERLIQRRREADGEFNALVETIRAQPEFSNFLQTPTTAEIVSSAIKGPVIVINTSRFRCDAFLIQHDAIRVIPLSGLTQDDVDHQVRSLQAQSVDLSSSLEWIWNIICCPILEALGFREPVSNGNWPHVWWVPTGLLSQLPLHAAGIYTTHKSRETVLDRVVSSYTSSIKALQYGRKNSNKQPDLALQGSGLMVAMRKTPGLVDLDFAEDEVDMLKNLCPQLQLHPITPSPQKRDILIHLPKCTIFHFAGHGSADLGDPSRSCLHLEDWKTNPLTVRDIRDSRLHEDPPFLAYLSACSTGATKAVQLVDETVNIVNAFQLAGFQHVIGTLWEVSDKHCVDVATILYKTLQEEGITDTAVSRGLHRAMRIVRNGGKEEDECDRDATLLGAKQSARSRMNFFWVPYVHFGV